MRLVLPTLAALLGVLAAVAALALGAPGDSPPAGAAPAPPAAPAEAPALALGLVENHPALIAPGRPARGFGPWRDRTAALRPRFFRLLVPWKAVQPTGRRPPDWRALRDGCQRGVPPCAPHRGLGALLRAVRQRQALDGGWEVVVSPYDAPEWALRRSSPAGCPRGGTIRTGPYRRLLRSLAALGRKEGVALRYWSPWNEPNHPYFLRPQRRACRPAAQPLAPAAYADLVRAARAELPPGAELLVGELAGFDRPRSDAVGAVEFVRALPQDVVCAGRIWAQHTYIGSGSDRFGADLDRAGDAALLGEVQTALDARGCPEQHRIWITETGAFTRPGACGRMHAALASWARNPRVDAAFQYLVREDPLFRTGLASEHLDVARPAYAAWRGWAGGAAPPAGPPPGCR